MAAKTALKYVLNAVNNATTVTVTVSARIAEFAGTAHQECGVTIVTIVVRAMTFVSDVVNAQIAL